MTSTATPIRNTIEHLRLCQSARAHGHQVSYTTDATWLVHQAINRRAGWFDDPGCWRGSCRPLPVRQITPHGPITIARGKYPRKAIGETYGHLRTLAYRINTPGLVVRTSELGEWRKLLLARMPERFTDGWGD